MGYPDNKETWERVETDELIVKEHKNNWSIFLEGLQDTLGLGIKLGYGTVKLLLDYLKSKADLVDGKVAKAGDTMTGDLTLDKSDVVSPKVIFKTTGFPAGQTGIFAEDDSQLTIKGAEVVRMFSGAIHVFGFEPDVVYCLKKMSMQGQEIVEVKYIDIDEAGYIDMATVGSYIKMQTPDGTKNYNISIDNAGNVITTLA